jgi:hypothetical protein
MLNSFRNELINDKLTLSFVRVIDRVNLENTSRFNGLNLSSRTGLCLFFYELSED